MEFLNNTKNFGLIVMVLAAIDLVIAVIGIVDSGVGIGTIGAILSPIVMILAGLAIFSQTNGGIISFAFPEGSKSKFGALTGFIFATGIANIVSLTIGGIILGIIIVIVGWIITNDKNTFLDSVIWVILVILFAISAILGLLGAFSGDIFGIIGGILSAVLYLMAFLYLLDADVKKKLM